MYPRLNATGRTRTVVKTFGGYEHLPLPAFNSFYDMENLSSDLYPVLTTRKRRGTYASPAAPAGLIGKDALSYVDGNKIYVNGYPVDLSLSACAEGETKTLISMGAYILIFPDRKYINTRDLTDFGSIDAAFASVSDNEVTFLPVDEAGESLEGIPASDAAPSEPTAGEYWIDTSETPHRLRMWSDSAASWVVIESTAVRMEATGIGAPFQKGDGVKISGIEFDDALNGFAVVSDAGEDYLVVPGLIEEVVHESGSLVIERKMPLFDYVTEAGNRLWACRWGVSEDGKIVNEIYASKLGDFKNWNCFEGLSTDSYAASCGTDGAWTGAATYLGSPCFFKENVLHKVYVAANGGHSIRETALHGVKRGCSKTLVTVGQTLYYLSPAGVMAYDGSLPVLVSAALGDLKPENAAAGAYGDKYYLSGEVAGAWHLWVYDTAKNLWHREDDTHAEVFAAAGEELYFIENGSIRTVGGSGTEDEEAIRWSAETGPIGLTSPDCSSLCRLELSLELPEESSMRIEIEYDGDGRWERSFELLAGKMRRITLPILPRRAQYLRLRFSGEGQIRLYALAAVNEEGSDR